MCFGHILICWKFISWVGVGGWKNEKERREKNRERMEREEVEERRQD